MAEEPLIQRVDTLKLGGLRRVASGYLHPWSPGSISSLKVHTDENTINCITYDLKTPRSISVPIPKPAAEHGISFFPRSNSAPALYTEEKGVVNRDSFFPHRHRLTNPQITLVTLLGLLLYIIIFVSIFTFASEGFKGKKTLKPIDAIYFAIVTLSTIGYGDIVPSTTFTKLFTCLFILLGFGFIGTLLNGLVTYVLDRQEEVLLGAVDQNQFIKMIEKYVFDKNKGRMRIRTKMGLALGVVFLSLVIGTVTAHFLENLSWVDSFYLSVTSVTTVGYGDYAFETQVGRCFAVIWLLTSTLVVARAFMYLVEHRIEKRNHRTASLVLQKKFTLGDLVVADLDRDGSISKAEYVVYKLREMGKVKYKDVREICQQFDTMESPDHSKITIADLMGGGKDSPRTYIRSLLHK